MEPVRFDLGVSSAADPRIAGEDITDARHSTQDGAPLTRTLRVGLLSTYPPRACGIGAFSFDIRSALLDVPGIAEVHPVALVERPPAPPPVELLATVCEDQPQEYRRAARLLGRHATDVVLLQHEFGIFGGPDGEHALAFAEALSSPLVVTLHTVLSEPSVHQRDVLRALCRRAERLIVMTETARRLLVTADASTAGKLHVIPHGAPVQLGERCLQRPFADDGSFRSRFLLTSFGLLSPGKGLETTIRALPRIVERHPELLYLIAGRTHPQVALREGQRYRRMLERLVGELGLGDHVLFDDRFLAIDELARLLQRTDVFVTPYRSREQVSSGALTFALAAGCAAVSTPYWYAREMLASGAGLLVPFDDPEQLAGAVCAFARDPALLARARAEARRIGSRISWPSVAAATAAVLQEAAAQVPRTAGRPASVPARSILRGRSTSPAPR